jgi:two-component system sensor histidine kinase KdpD
MRDFTANKNFGYVAALVGMGIVTTLLRGLASGQVNSTTVALALLLVVLLVATGWGSRPAILAAVVGMLCFNYFFLPPVGTWTIADPQNWIALAAFLVTAIVTGQLSARAKQRAEEAEANQRELERLYQESQEIFERASEAKALRRSEQLKSALLDAVTHDLRTPLTAIKVSATALLEEWREPRVQLADDDRREMLEVIDEEADRLNRFIENMVELARLEAGAFVLPHIWGDLEEIIKAALHRAERVTAGYRLEVVCAPELPLVRADERALAEVIYTLIDNACKYSPAGTRVAIRAELLAKAEQIRVSVTDEGSGIPPELRTQVFDKFFRAAAAAKRLPRGGTGMGLAIARGIVEAHGGRIWIEDGARGRGTRVCFTVPIGDHDEPVEGMYERTQTHSDR